MGECVYNKYWNMTNAIFEISICAHLIDDKSFMIDSERLT